MVDMGSTIKMEFSEMKAEAYCSLSNQPVTLQTILQCFAVEILTDPSMYFAQELDEAIQVEYK